MVYSAGNWKCFRKPAWHIVVPNQRSTVAGSSIRLVALVHGRASRSCGMRGLITFMSGEVSIPARVHLCPPSLAWNRRCREIHGSGPPSSSHGHRERDERFDRTAGGWCRIKWKGSFPFVETHPCELPVRRCNTLFTLKSPATPCNRTFCKESARTRPETRESAMARRRPARLLVHLVRGTCHVERQGGTRN